jgi:hypothetical protein
MRDKLRTPNNMKRRSLRGARRPAINGGRNGCKSNLRTTSFHALPIALVGGSTVRIPVHGGFDIARKAASLEPRTGRAGEQVLRHAEAGL